MIRVYENCHVDCKQSRDRKSCIILTLWISLLVSMRDVTILKSEHHLIFQTCMIISNVSSIKKPPHFTCNLGGNPLGTFKLYCFYGEELAK